MSTHEVGRIWLGKTAGQEILLFRSCSRAREIERDVGIDFYLPGKI